MKDRQNIAIAIANSEQLVLDSMAMLLVNEGFDVIAKAQNGEELISLLESLDNLPDVCIIDVFMPGLGGLETMEELYKRWPQMRVFVLSSWESAQIVTRMLIAGACAYLKKNISCQKLSEAIIAVHNNGVYFSELVSSQYWGAIQKKQIKLPNLTAAEMRVLKYCCMDLTYEEIACKLHITVASTKGHRDSMFKKLGIHNRVGLFRFAIENGIDPFGDLLGNRNGELFYQKPLKQTYPCSA